MHIPSRHKLFAADRNKGELGYGCRRTQKQPKVHHSICIQTGVPAQTQLECAHVLHPNIFSAPAACSLCCQLRLHTRKAVACDQHHDASVDKTSYHTFFGQL